MLLAIDIGNTQTVLGCYLGNQLKKSWRLSTSTLGTGDEVLSRVNGLFLTENLDLREIQSVIISSVVPAATRSMKEAFSNRNLKIVDHRWGFSFFIQANPPAQIGSDRLVNAEAAVREYGAPVMIVDSGTATTLCAISHDREYLGGAIMPGIEFSMETLARRTAKLFSVELSSPERAIGRNTSEALQSGILLGYASMIDGMIVRFKKEMRSESIPVVATGGVSALLRGIAKELQYFEPDLTLKGLSYLHADRNN